METKGDSDVQVILRRSARPAQLKAWCFTWNNYGELDAARLTLTNALIKLSEKLVFQPEIGANGTEHIQGVVVLRKRGRWSEFGLPNTIHWEPCRSIPLSINYCMKMETRNPKYLPFTFGITDESWKQVLLAKPLRDWQSSIEEIFHTEPDDRKIYWYHDSVGASGKTFVTKYMILKYPNRVVGSTCTRSNDILTSASETAKMYILNFPRSVADFAPYNAIEQLKDGFICDAKLKKEARTLLVPPAHVIVFANFMPNVEMLSADRWVLRDLSPRSEN